MIVRNRRIVFLALAAALAYAGYILFNNVQGRDDELYEESRPIHIETRPLDRGAPSGLLAVSNSHQPHTISKLLLNVSGDRVPAPVYSNPPPTHEHRPGPTKLNIILLSYMRSGTSFLGNIFQSNPDMFYIFEPYHAFNYLKGIGTKFPGDIPDFENQPTIAKGKLLDNFLTCNFTYEMYFDYLNDRVRDKVYTSKLQIGLSRPLKELCATIKTQEKSKECHGFTPKNLGTKCLSYPYTALKIIRVSNLSAYAEIIQSTNTKVVHLVRDPRAMFYSRTRIGYAASRETKVKICNAMVTNAEGSLRGPSWGLGGIYIIVRYEDVAFDPETWTRTIYKDIGISPHEQVIKWLDANTKSDPKKYQSLTTNRNSTNAALHWRIDAPWSLVADVQSIEPCLKAMRIYGYHKLNSEADMRNMAVPSQTKTLQDVE